MAKATDMVEGRAADGGNMAIKRKITIKDNTKVTAFGNRGKRVATKGNGGGSYFSALLRCANEKILSFGRIKRKTV